MGSNVVPALVDRGRLEAAVHRCQHAARYESASLIRQACILAVAVSQAQAFEDGNKRCGYGALIVFLRRNGFRFAGASLQIALFLEVCAFLSQISGYGGRPMEVGLDAFALWLESAIEPQ